MKAWLLAVLVAALGALAVHGEDFVAPQDPAETPVTPVPVAPRPALEGVLTALFRLAQPWQLFSPLAPASYGDGQGFVSRNPDDPERPDGIIVFGVDW